MKLSLDKSKKYVVACSFGPDSMALLDMMLKDGYDLVVAHVNYHKRKESDFEEDSLRKYCKTKKIKCFVLDTSKMEIEGNFQDWARKVRYEFFKHVCDENQCDFVVIAHQEDDLIETYLMQKNKKSFVSYYGIEKETELFGVKVIRPLLNVSKRFLEEYDKENNVPYSIDWTNLTNTYTRNKIRHEIVEKMTDEERKNIRKEINRLNEINSFKNNQDLTKNIWELTEFLNFKNEEIIMQISHELSQKHIFKKITQKNIETIKKAFASSSPNIIHKMTGKISLVKSYSNVYLIDFSLFRNYEYVLDKPGSYNFEFIEFSFGINDVDRNISKNDFPLTIKPAKNSKTYIVKDYETSVRRLFIDWKMPVFLRDWWPGIYNKDGLLVYIPRYREKYSDNHVSKLVIKVPQF